MCDRHCEEVMGGKKFYKLQNVIVTNRHRLYNTKQQNVEHKNTLKMHDATLLNVMIFFSCDTK